MTAPLPTPAVVEEMRERHSRRCLCFLKDNPANRCDVGRLLALVDRLEVANHTNAAEAHRQLRASVKVRARLAAVLAECDAADSQARASTARTFDGEPFPVLLDPDRIRRLATGEAS